MTTAEEAIRAPAGTGAAARAPVRVGLALAALLGCGACGQPVGLAAVEVLNETSCKGAEDGMRRLSYAEVAALRGSTLIGVTAPDDAESPELVLLSLSRGRQPTPGYRFELEDATLEENRAQLSLRWHTPEPGAVVAQVVTYPCIVVGLERGAFSEVRASDENGELIGEIRL